MVTEHSPLGASGATFSLEEIITELRRLQNGEVSPKRYSSLTLSLRTGHKMYIQHRSIVLSDASLGISR